MNFLSPIALILEAAVCVLILWQKGYLDDVLGLKQAVKPSSDKLFEKAIVVALDEAKDRKTQELIQTLKAKVEEAVANPFASAAATPPAPPAPAPAP